MLAGFVFALDRTVKYVLMQHGSLGTLLPSLNDAIAFSLPFPRRVLVFTIVVIIVLLVIALVRAIQKRSGIEVFGYGCVVVGAISNLIDRLRFGSVVDYIAIWIIPIFNLGDVLIVVGVAVLLIHSIWQNKRAE